MGECKRARHGGELESMEGLPFPERARRSCCALHSAFNDLPANMDSSRARALAKTLDVALIKRLGSSLAMDANATGTNVKFESVDEEGAMICLMHALDFGGGWRQELHKFHGKGAWLTVKPGIEAMFQAEPSLSAKWLAGLSCDDIATLFKLRGAEELQPFVQQLRDVTQELGNGLIRGGWRTLADFVRTSLTAESTPGEGRAASFVRRLVETFPRTFDDRYLIRGRPVFLYKKAQLVVGELFHRFRDEDPRFAFADGELLTAFIDNVICAVLRKDGIVTVSDSLAKAIEDHQHLPSGSEEEVALRAAAMAGVEEVVINVRALGFELTANEYGNYLWGILGKAPEYRPYTRHSTKDSVFY
eukprot:TRINITY_DN96610_c0_g1_i1.p1 TRINITY_DN96610_c0_g1~~TRINITY_DN96610_c0_g1_i1.p1  ORF type:complete len:388 (-),score=48.04 TRINITY_DN96610_c0_g1_i1:25-1104(-)